MPYSSNITGAPPVLVNGTPVRIGTSSWSDRSLTQDSQWYPKKTMKAAERIAFYAQHLPIVEIENTYRFPPTPAVAQQWVDRTPDGFTIDLPIWSLLSEQPTVPPSLWEDLFTEVRPDRRDHPRLYSSHLSDEGMQECWRRFRHAVAPLAEAGRLGTLILRYPKWFGPRETSIEVLERTREHLGDLPVAVEFSCDDWLVPTECETTFSLLEELDLAFVCVDAPENSRLRLHGASATTSDIAVLRLSGRREFDHGEWVADWRGYRYGAEELRGLSRRIHHLASGAKEVHVLVSTCWRDDAVANAQALTALLSPLDLRSAD